MELRMRVTAAGMAAAALAGAWLWQDGGAPPQEPQPSLASATGAPADAAAQRQAPAVGPGCDTPGLFSATSPGGPGEEAPDAATAQLAYTAPHTLAQRAHAEPAAAIALYDMLSYCASMPDRDAGPAPAAPLRAARMPACPAIDPATLVRRHPVELLQQAAALGSIAAQARLLDQAPAVAEEFRQSETEDGQAYARQLMAAAERHGVDAARAGSLQAMRLMSAAYASGQFGAPDPLRAYLYALPLQAAGSDADRQRLARLGESLGAAGRQAASRQAYGCQPAAAGSVLASPFR
ncbi:hypothetical protein ACLB1G_04935 [Oxalobacteraceae bacterium A2-2]